jgi:hypothetical protein
MSQFQGRRFTHEYTHNVAPPETVFPLLCPVREADWVPGWRYRLIYSESGIAEYGCVFITPNEDGTETTWVVTDYDPPSFRIACVGESRTGGGPGSNLWCLSGPLIRLGTQAPVPEVIPDRP